MIVIDFDKDLLGSGEIFPSNISGLQCVGYHGTSSFYSHDIESKGFSPERHLFFPVISDLIVEGDRLGFDTSKVQGFKKMKTTSFSPISETCLHYVQNGNTGGQGVNYMKELCDDIINSPCYDKTTSIATEIVNLSNQINAIKSFPCVVYAVDLNGVNNDSIYFNTVTKAIHVNDIICHERIIAKIITPSSQTSPLTLECLNSIILSKFYRAEPHFIKKLSGNFFD